MNTCKLCDNTVENKGEFCIYHNNALDNLNSGYVIWKNRVDYIEREQYLKTLLEISTTGTLVKQIIMDELGR
tara:strand:+ start:704 stop:919 length:216 start_codon:yes stop_codon:yes gene_type:complete